MRMSEHVERRAGASQPAGGAADSLVDLMYDGFHALFLLRSGSAPQGMDSFADHMTQFLHEVGQRAQALGVHADDVDAAKYAFCAAVDEIVLRSSFAIRGAWEARPLQLRMFGDQLAGEHFFQRLEALRARGSAHVQALEVFHMCLLLGFQGRYALDGEDKLKYLAARLGDEIARMRGKSRSFAPHAQRPDQVANKLRTGLPLWTLTAMFALVGLGGYTGFRATLGSGTEDALAPYNGLVKLPPKAASVTITIP
jgi:type VI secretion system protein ImpK